jgi:hypothetical protein
VGRNFTLMAPIETKSCRISTRRASIPLAEITPWN